MVNPPTFMYIKTFEDVRKYMVEKTHISLFVEWGYLGMFSPTARVDSAFFVLDKEKKNEDSLFIKLNDLYEMKRKKVLFDAYADYCNSLPNDRVYLLPQDKLKAIKSWPFIYWISDEFREKFGLCTFNDISVVAEGCKTANNFKFLRFWWERNSHRDFNSQVYPMYAKGGEYCKWYGNLWLELLWGEGGKYFKSDPKATANNEDCYFKEGITFTGAGSKGVSFRLLPENSVFDTGSRSIFSKGVDTFVLLSILNSSLGFYVFDCLNPTVNTTVGDVKRMPYIEPTETAKKMLHTFSKLCSDIQRHIRQFRIEEVNYTHSPIGTSSMPTEELSRYYDYENGLLTQILINEAIINRIVFDVYELSEHDRQMVLDKEGIPVGDLSVSQAALDEYKQWLQENQEFPASEEFWEHLSHLTIDNEQPQVSDFEKLYQNNYGWEEFCGSDNHRLNPIEVWYQFRHAGILPPQRSQSLAFELITDVIRTVLSKDDDGVIPLCERMGEEPLDVRIEQELVERDYSGAHISQIVHLLSQSQGSLSLRKYLYERFFQQLSDHLNLFMYLPKTPFIWHLTSGDPASGRSAIDLYVSIYTWSRDTLFRIKSVYVANRENALADRLAALDPTSASGKMEAALIKDQQQELRQFADKIDQLLASGYDPKLDDGVGKNIAPLQNAGLLSYDVLNSGQLKKYLNADW